jgi:hypothetical protein
MSNLPISQIQADVRTRILADTWFAGVEIFIEDDPAGTAADDKTQEDREEAALAAKGLALKVLSPDVENLDETTDDILLGGLVAIAVVENRAINRAPGGHGKSPLDAIEHVITALKPDYKFPKQQVASAVIGEDLKSYVIIARSKRVIFGA